MHLPQRHPFRLLFISATDQDVNFDAILGELYELESQLNNTQNELSRSLASGNTHPPPPAAFQDEGSQIHRDTAHVSEQVGYKYCRLCLALGSNCVYVIW